MQAMTPHHLTLRAPQQFLVAANMLDQYRERLPEERVRTLVLLHEPSRNPLLQHWIDQHLHQRQSPTNIVMPSVEFALKLHIQVTCAEIPLLIGYQRISRRIHEQGGSTTNTWHGLHAHSVSDHSVPFCRLHVPPVRQHRHASITLVAGMLYVGTICAVAWRYHQTDRSCGSFHTPSVHKILPPELIQRHMLQLGFRHILDASLDLFLHQLQSLVELVHLAIIVHGLVLTQVLHHPLWLQGTRPRRVQAHDRHHW